MTKDQITKFLKFTVFLLFIGRAYQHLFWDAPYRSFFWDEELLAGLVERITGLTWYEYATHPNTDLFVRSVIKSSGVLYLICAVLVYFMVSSRKWIGKIVLLGSFSLGILAFLYSKDKFYHSAQFLEYALQVGTPVLLYFWVYKEITQKRFILIAKILVAVTFTAHGLYAAGIYFVPGKFIDMTISVLGVSEPVAMKILLTAGYLDFLLAICIFIPQTSRIALLYAASWGLATSITRLWANFYVEIPLESIHAWLCHVVYRLPHALIPFVLFRIEIKNKKAISSSSEHKMQQQSVSTT